MYRDITGYVAPLIQLIRQHGRRHLYRLFDGVHRFNAAKRAGRKTIAALVIVQ